MIRPFHHLDTPYLWAIHRSQGYAYPFPDLGSPVFAGVLVAVDENDVPVSAVATRKTVEVYMIADPSWGTPAWRMRMLYQLHMQMHALLVRLGFTDAQCVLPPQVERSFGRRLQRDFGWVPSKWKWFCKYL